MKKSKFENINIKLKNYLYDSNFRSETNFIGKNLSTFTFDNKLSRELIDSLETKILQNLSLQIYFQLQSSLKDERKI